VKFEESASYNLKGGEAPQTHLGALWDEVAPHLQVLTGPPACPRTCRQRVTHTHACAGTCTHTYARMHAHTSTQICAHTRTHIHKHKQTASTCTWTHTKGHDAHTHTQKHKQMHTTSTHTCKHACAHAPEHAGCWRVHADGLLEDAVEVGERGQVLKLQLPCGRLALHLRRAKGGSGTLWEDHRVRARVR